MTQSTLSIIAVPAFQDNYIWLIHNGRCAVAVDPGDAKPVMHALKQHHLKLSAILLTHHHNDHIGGVDALLHHTSVPVYGPKSTHIPFVTHICHDNDKIQLSDIGLELDVFATPAHTLDHIVYYVPQQHWLFCGDTLFAAGCGRLFEGTAAQMLAALNQLATLPDDTQVYCAHEYTLSNLQFAHAVEPDNVRIMQRFEIEQEKRQQGLPTVPTTIALEKQTNPFLRTKENTIIQRLKEENRLLQENPVDVLAALREWKNQF